ncbi:ATP-dependent bile acid permease-like protein [Elsinoe fawcettii]|nr:ATP-dependent bile acid permease-like protein [Elsinoe fawcettii]
MSTIMRTLRNLRKIGLKDFGHQMQYIGDTKAGALVGTDLYGNKYYENLAEELPLRTRWVDYKDKEYDPSQIEPGWHAWMSYMVDKPPTEDPILQRKVRVWEPTEHRPVMTMSRSAYKPYSTVKSKYAAWQPVAASRYLQTLVPLIAVGISISLLAIQILSSPWRKQSQDGYTLIDPTGAYVHTNGGHKYPASSSDEDTDDDGEDTENLTLQPTISRAGLSTYTVDKPKGALLIPIIEELAVVADLGIQIAALASGAWGKQGGTAAAASVAVWVYITALTSMRLLFTIKPLHTLPNFWYHTTFLYLLEWLCGVLLFRSQLIHPYSGHARILMILHFALITILAIIALSTRIGNTAVEIEHEDNLEPSKELTTSVFGMATFTWLDPLIYKAYKQTLEIPDVWNLIPEDKAAKVLADYRQVKKTSILAVHLLKFFSKDILLQAFFAAISGLNTFIPTLLLKVILEYVENPATKSANAAWFYVILMFVSGTIQALTAGQALFIGRKICIRLRAVIIGEIYAKALRRRAAATSDKVLGQDQEKPKDGEKPVGLVKKVSMFFKKKKDKPSPPTVKEPTDEGQVTSGAIINLMAVDSFKVAEVCAYLHFLWAETPVQLVIAIVLLYKLLGYSSIAGIGMMIILAPINLFISKQFATIQKKILAATDARIHTTNEVLTNIRIIKYFAWEHRFTGQVDEKRTIELRYLRNRYIVWSFAATTWTGAPIIISFLTFLVYTTVEKRPLIPSVAFTALSLFSILRVPLDQLADMVAHVQESKVSVDRVEEYLSEAETEKYEQLKPDQYDDSGEPIIGYENCNFSWGATGDEDFKLIDIDMKFKVGQLNVIVGPTGSGKTSMLMALLGEMSLLNGQVYLPGVKSREDVRADPETGLTETVAYCAQQAWLVNGTIKDNIVFASAFDAKRYKDVIVACSLQRDLEILDKGDQTLVGEKGVTLSGGQKQRISLARALYCRARHVLLDDVLSAVDAHTAKWIFDKAIMGPLMYHRTCILVTHNTQLCVPRADFAVVMDNGRIASQGSATKVIDSGKLSEDLSKSRPVSRAPSRIPSRVPSDVGGDNENLIDQSNNEHINGDANGNGIPTEYRDGADLVRVVSNKQIPGIAPEVSTAMPQEEKAVGSVSFKIIFMYLRYMGGFWYWTVACLAFALQQLSQVGTNVWIRQWANAYGDRQEYATFGSTAVNTTSLTHLRGTFGINYSCVKSGSCLWPMSFSTSTPSNDFGVQSTTSAEGVNDAYYLGIYAVIGITYMLVTLLRVGWVFVGSILASKRIHHRLIETVLHAKFRFFDSTPLGQIMNRFSKDIELVDQEIAPVAEGVVHCLASIITIIILISVITPQFLIAAVFISILYFLIGSFYINSSRDLKRLESVQRSPLYQQFGETLSGMTTIRAYSDERRFVRENIQKINTHSRPFIFLWAANRWLAFRVDIVGALVSFFTGVFVILSVGRIDAGAAGLAMTYAVTFTENVLWFVRLYSMNEQNMNAIERIKEYFDVEQEAPPIIEENRPPSNWPSKGGVELIGYSTRYRKDFDFVLKNITFKILPGEKVGVVGRTGAGKSSLALALFRALEAEEGKVLIDDVDIGLIGLQDLRENIVMVPQDPTLFTGTIRNNLDPFGLYTDEEIFDALRRVQLIGVPGSSAEPSRPSTPVSKTASSSLTSSPVTKTHLSPDSPTVTSDATTTVLENKNIFKNLSSSVAESGSNLSQGQRQLLCLARALLKAPKVLLMDEATASIDYATDAKIQETIREFKNTTLTIAHRLQTIIDYDKVLVLDKGEVLEYGDPYDLVRKEAGSFRGMCESSGELETLEKEAKKAWQGRRLVDDS